MNTPNKPATHTPQQSVEVSDRKMYLGQGIECLEARCTLVFNGSQYELALHHGGQPIPVIYRGPLSIMLSVGQAFIDARHREGYVEQLPSFEPVPIN